MKTGTKKYCRVSDPRKKKICNFQRSGDGRWGIIGKKKRGGVRIALKSTATLK